ncbi:MAG: hypothetical protein K940chlam1_01054 [Candidatus Anoxychlamydiales bacterium]|nr:hypothetical protein [Candidatus Anoxychlamydiales bacterium]NGX35920.1 hypothetical protein [Candidatus Anoxychlamydiales bacterium]
MQNNNYYVRSHKRNGRFINIKATKRVRRTLLDFFLWKIGKYKFDDEIIEIPTNFSFPKIDKPFYADKPWVTWVGHCTFLIKVNGFYILTDPIWNDNCSPVSSIGPKRHHPPALDLATLSRVDYVMISHDHYDHLDKKTIIALQKKFPNIKWVVPLGIERWFKKWKIKNVTRLDWWESFEDDFIKINSVPAQHYSGRTLLDGNKTLWTGYVLESKCIEKKLYLTGDTGYNDVIFKEIGNRFKKIDLSLIPIGTYVPRKFMNPVHIDPQAAVHIHKDVNSELSIAMHWKTFHLSDESMQLPPYELYLELKKENIDTTRFAVLELGSYVNW